MTDPHTDTQGAAKRLHVSVHTVRELIRSGRLKARRRGNSNRSGYLIELAELDRYIASLPTTTPTEQDPDQ